MSRVASGELHPLCEKRKDGAPDKKWREQRGAEELSYSRGEALMIKLCLVCCFLFASSYVASAPKQNKALAASPYADFDAYQIYANLLAGEKAPPFVIRAETESWEKTTPKKLDIKGDPKFRRVWGGALKNLATEYRTPKLLSQNIPLAAAYRIVPESSLNNILSTERGWTVFSEQYHAYGFYSFSPVGFNGRKTRAVVWMMFLCGGLCGHGTYHFFEKRDGRWHEVSVRAEVPNLVS